MNMTIFGEMLTALKPGQEDPADYKLLTDLSGTCRYVTNAIRLLVNRNGLTEYINENEFARTVKCKGEYLI